MNISGCEKEELRDDCLKIIIAVWQKIDWGGMSPMRRMKIYDELAGKIKSSAMTSSLSSFIDKLTRKFEVRSLGKGGLQVKEIMCRGNDADLLRIFREETVILVIMLREWVEARKLLAAKKEKEAEENEDEF